MKSSAAEAGAKGGLRGWHVLVILLVFFGLIMAVNGVFITLALSSFPGEETQHAYAQGLHYNQTLEARRREAALGWKAALLRTDRIDGRAVIAVRFSERDGGALSSLNVKGELRRPMNAAEDSTLDFMSLEDGVYQATVPGAKGGAWDLRVTAHGSGDKSISFSERVTLP